MSRDRSRSARRPVRSASAYRQLRHEEGVGSGQSDWPGVVDGSIADNQHLLQRAAILGVRPLIQRGRLINAGDLFAGCLHDSWIPYCGDQPRNILRWVTVSVELAPHYVPMDDGACFFMRQVGSFANWLKFEMCNRHSCSRTVIVQLIALALAAIAGKDGHFNGLPADLRCVHQAHRLLRLGVLSPWPRHPWPISQRLAKGMFGGPRDSATHASFDKDYQEVDRKVRINNSPSNTKTIRRRVDENRHDD